MIVTGTRVELPPSSDPRTAGTRIGRVIRMVKQLKRSPSAEVAHVKVDATGAVMRFMVHELKELP